MSAARRFWLLGNQIGDQVPSAILARAGPLDREFRSYTVLGSVAGEGHAGVRH